MLQCDAGTSSSADKSQYSDKCTRFQVHPQAFGGEGEARGSRQAVAASHHFPQRLGRPPAHVSGPRDDG